MIFLLSGIAISLIFLINHRLMFRIHRIVNNYQNSCTYILYQQDDKNVWLVDCGDSEPVEDWLKLNRKCLKGVFLTHCHDDHIFGLRQLLKIMPEVNIYLSEHEGLMCVQSIRMNLSKYTSSPFQLLTNHFVELKNGESVSLFPDIDLKAIQADGHSPDSMIYKVGQFLFTGDAYVPPFPVVTKLPGGDKKRAAESLKMIENLIEDEKLIVLAGHYLGNKNDI